MDFIGRTDELTLLDDWNTQDPKLTVIYGRRRVGKSRLVEEAGKNRRFFKFEGIEGQGKKEQQRAFMTQISIQFNAIELTDLVPKSWDGLFLLLSKYLGSEPCFVLFDEFQWLASEKNELVGYLKYAWDNIFKKNNRIHLILCGSVSSFMVKKVMRSKALYGRIGTEIHLRPLLLPVILKTLSTKRSIRELVELYMVIGGIPQYLEIVDFAISVRLNLEKLCFTPNGYLVNELDRILISHFGKNRTYRNILLFLAKTRWANRKQLQAACHIDSGGRFSQKLEDLELAGFIEKYASISKPGGVRNCRYRITDPYLLFYFSFIFPNKIKISQTDPPFPFNHYLPDKRYYSWQELAFERICYQHHRLIAEKLGFIAVQYEVGSWFEKGDNNTKTQIDLLYIRADGVITLCEIKYTRNKIGHEIIKEIEKKVATLPNPKMYTIEKVLISASATTKPLLDEGYFNQILLLENIFK